MKKAYFEGGQSDEHYFHCEFCIVERILCSSIQRREDPGERVNAVRIRHLVKWGGGLVRIDIGASSCRGDELR